MSATSLGLAAIASVALAPQQWPPTSPGAQAQTLAITGCAGGYHFEHRVSDISHARLLRFQSESMGRSE